ncbi:SLC13 family permease [Bordetella petrii]|uniref:SLC13 family permease n=1 Tax=Bordetella petrii TaxID=94624 RepID=UPI001A977AB8|nr:SLC13 family permease [Bordetella petrii]MBO1113823.1 SLC13 family permease [Bordetella petrii]
MVITAELAVVLAILGGAIVLFLAGRPRADAVALLVLLLLPLSGSVTLREALEGFSNPNVILIACLFVIGEGLVRTGVAQRVGDWLIRHGGSSETRLIVMLMAAVGLMGSIMSSTAVVAIFIPIVLRIARQSAMASRKMLMPMGMAAAISGMLTLVATTPNLIINSTLVYGGYQGFYFFDFTPIGLAIMAAGIAYMLAARHLLGAEPGAGVRSRPGMSDGPARHALQARDVGMVEVIIPPESGLVGDPVRHSAALRLHGLSVVGAWRGRKALEQLRGARIHEGDTLLVVGPWKGILSLQADEHDLVSLALPAEAEALAPAPGKAPHALFSLAVVVLLLLTGWVPNVMAGLIGCLLMGLSGCITLDAAYRAINWRSLILIVGMLPFAVALERSGGVDLAAELLLHLAGSWGTYGQLGVLFLATVILGIAISGTATAVLMGPIAIGIAEDLHVSPHAFAMTVAIAASAAFMSPVSTPANALVSVAAGYRFSDYLKLGTPLMVIAMVISVLLIPLLFPL